MKSNFPLIYPICNVNFLVCARSVDILTYPPSTFLQSLNGFLSVLKQSLNFQATILPKPFRSPKGALESPKGWNCRCNRLRGRAHNQKRGVIMNEQLILRNHLKEIRSEKGLSQQQLAELVGVSRNTISSIETGQFNPTAKLALILCIALDKKFEELFYFWLYDGGQYGKADYRYHRRCMEAMVA